MSADGIKYDHRDLASPLSGNLIASPGQINAVSPSGRLQTIETLAGGANGDDATEFGAYAAEFIYDNCPIWFIRTRAAISCYWPNAAAYRFSV
jgi:hypothetical protein